MIVLDLCLKYTKVWNMAVLALWCINKKCLVRGDECVILKHVDAFISIF